MSEDRTNEGPSSLRPRARWSKRALGLLVLLAALACTAELSGPPSAEFTDSGNATGSGGKTGGLEGQGSGGQGSLPDDPFDAAPVCTSNTRWTGDDEESPQMNPGEACISCHTSEDEGPRLTIAGTLYPSAHEPNDCNGQQGSASVYIEITDAENRVFRLTPNSAGNFLLEDPDDFAFPYSTAATLRMARTAPQGASLFHSHTRTNKDCRPWNGAPCRSRQ
jgi:hypothetical protein